MIDKKNLFFGLGVLAQAIADNIHAEEGAIKQYNDQLNRITRILRLDEPNLSSLRSIIAEVVRNKLDADDITQRIQDMTTLMTPRQGTPLTSLAHIIKEEEEHLDHFEHAYGFLKAFFDLFFKL
jgi:bacterioferritin (cytochrome b1)